MDHSFAATCFLCNGMPPASKSGLGNFEAMPERRADVSSANVISSYTIRPLVRKGPGARGEPKAAGTAEIRKSGKPDPNCWIVFPEKRVLTSWMPSV
jgi:hypothetical protein